MQVPEAVQAILGDDKHTAADVLDADGGSAGHKRNAEQHSDGESPHDGHDGDGQPSSRQEHADDYPDDDRPLIEPVLTSHHHISIATSRTAR